MLRRLVKADLARCDPCARHLGGGAAVNCTAARPNADLGNARGPSRGANMTSGVAQVLLLAVVVAGGSVDVAAKIPKAGVPEAHDVFDRESHINVVLASAPHPGLLAAAPHIAAASGRPAALTMPFAGGGTLTAFMQSCRTDLEPDPRGGRPTVRIHVAQIVGAQLLEAAAHLHGVLGVVNNDVKPDNVLLRGGWAWSGDALIGCSVLLGDWGLACHVGQTISASGGTRRYQAPEARACCAAAPRRATGATDVYGIALVILSLLASSMNPDFATDESTAGHNDASESDPQHESDIGDAVNFLGLAEPDGLTTLLERMLAREPERRPSAAQALSEFRNLPWHLEGA